MNEDEVERHVREHLHKKIQRAIKGLDENIIEMKLMREQKKHDLQ